MADTEDAQAMIVPKRIKVRVNEEPGRRGCRPETDSERLERLRAEHKHHAEFMRSTTNAVGCLTMFLFAALMLVCLGVVAWFAWMVREVTE